MKQLTVILAMMLLLLSCSGRRQLSPEELSHKLDSLKSLEINEKLKLQGINLEESDNPLKQFYDSLELQTLPHRRLSLFWNYSIVMSLRL